jgi:hypothetical protein
MIKPSRFTMIGPRNEDPKFSHVCRRIIPELDGKFLKNVNLDAASGGIIFKKSE